MSSTISSAAATYSVRPLRYRSLQTLLALTVSGSLLCSYWLLPSRLERVSAALERGDQPVIDHELARAAEHPTDPGETRALADVALTLGEPDVAAAILEQSLAQQPNNLTAMRRLLEIQRQRHRMGDVAALDERIHARTGDPDALREAADIYASQHRTTDRIDALQRLNAIGHASAADIAELAHRLSDAGKGREAAGLVMGWLTDRTKPLPSEIIALAAALTADADDAEVTATRLGAMIDRAGEAGPLYVLTQTYAERGHPNLSLVAGLALGDAMQAKPEVALLLAQLETSQGRFGAARRRLDTVYAAGQIPPAGLAMLADLSLQTGDIARATSLTAGIPADELPEGFPHRLVDAAFAAGRMDALSRLPFAPLAAGSPGSAAVVALAQGDRLQARALVLRALGEFADLEDLGPAFGSAVRTLGLEHATIARLLSAAKAGTLGDQELSLLIDISATSRAEMPAVMQALRAQRDLTPRAGVVWAGVAARIGSIPDVIAWLQGHTGQVPTDALLAILLAADERASGELANAAAAMLVGRSGLPDGWTPAEIAFSAQATKQMTMARLREGLALLGSPAVNSVARNRIVANLVGARDFTRVAKALIHTPDIDGSIDWLVSAASQAQSPDRLMAQLGLLANIAPHRSLPLLAQAWTTDPRHLLSLYIAALIRDHQADAAQSVATSGLRGLSVKQQDAILYDALAGLQQDEALPLLRLSARLGRDDWITAYQEALAHAGLLDELRGELRAQAAAPALNSTRKLAIASRLVELNDRAGAIAILEKLASGLRPNDPVVEQLVYLWGPRADPDTIRWTRDRATAATLSELPKWLEHVAYLGAPRAVIEIVEARPMILGTSAAAIRTYGAALIAADVQSKPNLAAAIATNPAPEVADALAQLALDSGQAHPAWQASRLAVSRAPNDGATLLLAAQASASVRRSAEAAALYTKLLALGPQDPAVMIDAGDAMLAAKQSEAGRRVLAAALLRLPATPTTLGAARQRARALTLLKRSNEANVLLTQWLQRFPNDAGLQADLLQAKLDGTASEQ